MNSRIGNFMSPGDFTTISAITSSTIFGMSVPAIWDASIFSGRYPENLLEEISNYEAVASVIAHAIQFGVIHAHDWLTYPADVLPKQISGKPMVIHVHATDYDRSRGQVNPGVYRIEKEAWTLPTTL